MRYPTSTGGKDDFIRNWYLTDERSVITHSINIASGYIGSLWVTIPALITIRTFFTTSITYMLMVSIMGMKIVKEQKVFNSIIVTVKIYMMYFLFWFKKPTKVLFHHQPMFHNLIMTSFMWMFWTINLNISVISGYFSTLPSRIVFTTKNIISFISNSSTFKRTGVLFTNPTRFNIKYIEADGAFPFHNTPLYHA